MADGWCWRASIITDRPQHGHAVADESESLCACTYEGRQQIACPFFATSSNAVVPVFSSVPIMPASCPHITCYDDSARTGRYRGCCRPCAVALAPPTPASSSPAQAGSHIYLFRDSARSLVAVFTSLESEKRCSTRSKRLRCPRTPGDSFQIKDCFGSANIIEAK
jgi:hypothetical protein